MKLWTLALLPLLALSACKDGKDVPDDTDTPIVEPPDTVDTSLPPVIESFQINFEFAWDPEAMETFGATIGGADAWPTVYIEVGETSVFSNGSGESCLIAMTMEEPVGIHPFYTEVDGLMGLFLDGSELTVNAADCDGVFEQDDIDANVATFQGWSFFAALHDALDGDIADALEDAGVDPLDYLGGGYEFIEGNDDGDLDDRDYNNVGRAFAFEIDEEGAIDTEAQIDAEDYIVTITDSDSEMDLPTRGYWVIQNFNYWTWN